MTLTAALARGRAAAERMMVDTVTIDRADGTTARDPDTGAETPNYGAALYSGKARIQQRAAVSQEDEGAGRTVTTLRLELQLPTSVTGLQVDDRVTVNTAAHDADLVGRVFRVSALHHKTHATARRVAIEEATS